MMKLPPPDFLPDEQAIPVVPASRWRSFWLARQLELSYFWAGTRDLVDLIRIAFFDRLTREQTDLIKSDALEFGRTPPSAVALFIGAATGVLAILYLFRIGLPWPPSRQFLAVFFFAAWQFYRLCVWFGSPVVERIIQEQQEMAFTGGVGRRRRRPDISEEENEQWREETPNKLYRPR